ncbi:MAG TPA: alpha/beta fold hydrolase, partial [Acidobacteriaceae bacterium]
MIRFWLVFAAIVSMGITASAQTSVSIFPSAADLPAQQTAVVFGQKIAYYETGSGPTLVLVHGFGSQALFDWGRVIKPLARHHRVIALDQIGFGNSDKPFIDYRIQTFVDFLGEFLRIKKVSEFALAGESLGGWIVAAYTIQASASSNQGQFALPRPTHLILEDAAGHATIPHTIPV